MWCLQKVFQGDSVDLNFVVTIYLVDEFFSVMSCVFFSARNTSGCCMYYRLLLLCVHANRTYTTFTIIIYEGFS